MTKRTDANDTGNKVSWLDVAHGFVLALWAT